MQFQNVVFPSINVCNRNQIEASKIKDLGVYEDKELTHLLMDEFVTGSKKNISPAARELVEEVNDIIINSSKDDFADYASQSCQDLMIKIKFRGESLTWNNFDSDDSVGPWRARTDYGPMLFFCATLEYASNRS